MSERILLADAGLRDGLVDTLRRRLPSTWMLTDDPTAASAVLTENVDVDIGHLAARGAAIRLIGRMDTGSARVVGGDVRVVDLPNTALTGVAELTVTMILSLLKNVRRVHDATRAKRWLDDRSEPILTDQNKYTYNWIGIEDFGTVYRKQVGIVGLGHIGRAVAARLRPFGVRLLYTQRTRLEPEEEDLLGVAWRSLDALLAESDVVTLHHRFEDGDRGNDRQFGHDAFARMKRSAYFVNTARGRLVDEDALAAALTSGRIAGAALDVFRYEPLPAGHPFFDVPPDKLLLTPHVAGAPVDEAWRLAADTFIEALDSTKAHRT